MYKVLLVDDELHVCQLIQHLVDWEILGLKLVGMALSGVDALYQIAEEKPDIVMTDIRMSGYSGLELLKQVTETGYSCKFILISGYRQFEYAHQAIQYGVIDYLVKPLKKNELEAALRKAIAALQEERPAEKWETPPAPAARSCREQLINDLQTGALKTVDATANHLKEAYHIDVSGICYVFSWHFVCHGTYSDETLHMIEGKVSLWMEEQGAEWFRESFLLRSSRGVVAVCAVDRLDDLPSLQLIRETCQAVISIFGKWEAVLGVSRMDPAGGLEMPMKQAINAARSHIFDADHKIHFAEKLERSMDDFYAVISYDACDSLVAAVQILDADAVQEAISISFHVFAEHPRVSIYAVLGYIEWMIGEMNRVFSTVISDKDGSAYQLDGIKILQELIHSPSIHQLRDRLLEIVTDHIRVVNDAARRVENRPIRIAKQIVAEQYMEALSLSDVAAEVGLNPVYLSVLFKKETGTNFKDYVTNTRIEMAKRLLRSGESLTFVAEKVGYKDARYFSKLFKRIVGVNPTQYRKLYH